MALGYLFAIITAVSWSLLAIALKYALDFAGSGTIVWVRMMTAAIVLPLVLTALKKKPLVQLKGITQWPLVITGGAALAANYFGYMKGVEFTGANNVQVMIQLAPMSLALLGIVYFKETPNVWQWMGMVVAATGISLFYWDQILSTVHEAGTYFYGNLWIGFAVVTWVYFAFVQKLISQKVDPQTYNLVVYITSAIVLLPLANFGELTRINPLQGLLLFALGLNTIIAYGALGEALKRIPASHVSLIIICNPLLTLLMFVVMEKANIQWVAQEPVTARGYIGAFLVVTGVATAVAKKRQRPQTKAAIGLKANLSR